ncbi:hypothetical protein ACTXN4_23105 [Pseudomonas helleri]|uniref:hypothetical protein n=1 Tax=Pseudomonas helleri TaxID=1608996 RepID=UPI003FD1A848
MPTIDAQIKSGVRRQAILDVFKAQGIEVSVVYADVKGRLARYGRSPDELKILPGILPIVGRTEEKAQAKYQKLQELVHPQVGLSLLSGMIGADLSAYDIDGPAPRDLPETNGGKRGSLQNSEKIVR